MKQAKQVLSTPMSRKEFLRVLGVGLLSLLGVVNFISLLAKSSSVTTGSRTTLGKQDQPSSFGSRKFGA